MCLKNSDFRLIGLLFALARANGSLHKSSPSLTFFASVCSSNGGKWRAWGRLQGKLTVSTVLKRTLSSLLHRKGKLFFKYIKNHFSSIHFTCMSPNYWANYKWFWWTHQSTFNLRLRILAFIVLTWEVYKQLGVCIERHVRKTDEQEIPMTTVSWIS